MKLYRADNNNGGGERAKGERILFAAIAFGMSCLT